MFWSFGWFLLVSVVFGVLGCFGRLDGSCRFGRFFWCLGGFSRLGGFGRVGFFRSCGCVLLVSVFFCSLGVFFVWVVLVVGWFWLFWAGLVGWVVLVVWVVLSSFGSFSSFGWF